MKLSMDKWWTCIFLRLSKFMYKGLKLTDFLKKGWLTVKNIFGRIFWKLVELKRNSANVIKEMIYPFFVHLYIESPTFCAKRFNI